MSTPVGLKKSYYKYVDIQNKRINKVGNPFYASMADAILTATEKALDPSITNMHILAAQTGSGKSTYMEAMAAALLDNDLSCAIVAKTINQSHAIYNNVAKLVGQPLGKDYLSHIKKVLAGTETSIEKVAIYTSVHKVQSKAVDGNYNFTDTPFEKFSKSDKIRYPVVISTHTALLTELEENLDTGVQKHHGDMRNVIFLDESPEFNVGGMITKGNIESLKDELTHKKYKKEYNALTKFQKRFQKLINTNSANKAQYISDVNLFKPKLDSLFLKKGYASYFDEEPGKLPLLDFFDRKGKKQEFTQFLQFLKAAKINNDFLSKNKGAISYALNVFSNNPAFILLDATASIEEFQKLNMLSPSSIVPSPKVNYANLTIKHLTPPQKFTGSNTSNKSSSYIKSYKKFILTSTVKNSNKGDHILLVIKKRIADSIYTEKRIDPYHPLQLKGRIIHIIYWGSFIGENKWGKINKIFLFSGFIKPKEIYIGLDSAYKSDFSDDVLINQSGSKLQGDVLKLKENDSLRWFKQLAARGNIRNVNQKGEAGEMELYTDTDISWLIRNQERAFPKSPKIQFLATTVNPAKSGGDKIIHFLAHTKKGICTYDELVLIGGYKNRNQISRVLKTDDVKAVMRYLD